MRVVPLDAAIFPRWQALFEACGSPCYCRYWHFTGTKSDWLLRCAQEPETNRDEQRALVRGGAAAARGLVAIVGSDAVGWMKLAPREVMAKLVRLGAYRPLALGPDEGVWSIGCFLVHPAHRRGGVARALIAAAGEHVRVWNSALGPARPCVVEAYPRGDALGRTHDLHDEEAMMGTVRLFESCGFDRVAGEDSYPVMRKAV